MEQKNKPLLSLIILLYRNGAYAPLFVEETIAVLNGADIRFELILVGNYVKGSNDVTPQVVKELAQKHPFVKCVAKPKEGWMGWDIRSGLELVQGDYIGIIDGDGQFPVSEVVSVYQKILHEDIDIAKTYRIKRGDSAWRILISFCYNIIFKILFPGLKVRDVNSKPKIIKNSAYQKMHLVSDDWFFDAEFMIQARRYKMKIGEIPTNFLGLVGPRKSFVRINAIFEFVQNLIVYRIREFKYNFSKKDT